MEEDDDLYLSEEEDETEDAEDKQMLEHASMWDRFLAYVGATQVPWATPAADTDTYRKERAVDYFNKGTCCYLVNLAPLTSQHPHTRDPQVVQW